MFCILQSICTCAWECGLGKKVEICCQNNAEYRTVSDIVMIFQFFGHVFLSTIHSSEWTANAIHWYCLTFQIEISHFRVAHWAQLQQRGNGRSRIQIFLPPVPRKTQCHQQNHNRPRDQKQRPKQRQLWNNLKSLPKKTCPNPSRRSQAKATPQNRTPSHHNSPSLESRSNVSVLWEIYHPMLRKQLRLNHVPPKTKWIISQTS